MSLDPIVAVLQQYGSYVKPNILSMLYVPFKLRLPKPHYERLVMYVDSHHTPDAMWPMRCKSLDTQAVDFWKGCGFRFLPLPAVLLLAHSVIQPTITNNLAQNPSLPAPPGHNPAPQDRRPRPHSPLLLDRSRLCHQTINPLCPPPSPPHPLT